MRLRPILYSYDAVPQKFTGKERDQETGLDYFGARYMSGVEGRWISPEYSMNSVIMELPQTWNKYTYVYDRPTYATDPDGRCPPCIGAIIGGVVEGGFDIAKQLYRTGGSFSKAKGFSWGEAGANFAGGVVAGAIAGATGGTSIVADAFVGDVTAGVTSNMVGGVVTRSLDPNSDDVLSLDDISEDAVSGFAGGVAGHLAGEYIHVPDEPIHNARGSRGAIRRDDLKFAKYNSAIRNQIARATVAGSSATHTSNGLQDLIREWFFSGPHCHTEQTTVTFYDGSGHMIGGSGASRRVCN
jgi:RHS repeat-associated protein